MISCIGPETIRAISVAGPAQKVSSTLVLLLVMFALSEAVGKTSLVCKANFTQSFLF